MSDAIKVNELSHWLSSDALEICGLFYFEIDPVRQFMLIIDELTK